MSTIQTILLFLFITDVLSQPSCSNGKPNFLIIMTDDQGHDDIGFYHHNNILRSPNMDKFARQSVQFENFYTDSLCAPTRASLLTGRHHLKTGVWGVHGAMDNINLDETLMAQGLKQAGYKTSMFGKWHSGTTPGYNPWDRGFEDAYMAKLYTFKNNVVKHNGYDIQTQGWVEDWLADRIIEFLGARSEDGQPFMTLWTPMSIHRGRVYDFESYEDFVAPPEYYDHYSGRVSRDLTRVFASIEYFDTVLGRVLSKLDEFGLGDNTIVMFFGDNGPHIYNTDMISGPNRQLRVPSSMKDEKGFIEENGVRNFLFVRGLNRFPAGQKVYQNVGVIDVYPTMMDLAGASLPSWNKPLDGVSFAPLLCEGGTWDHSDRTLYFHEVLKNALGTDDIFALGDDRKVDRWQDMLSYYGGGSNGRGFELNSALKWQNWKYIKGNLFNVEETNHQEYFNQRTFDEGLQNVFKSQLSDWWRSVLNEYGAFQKPIYLIGTYQTSPVRVIGAIERTPINIKVTDHNALGFMYGGDYLICNVRVMEAGMYTVKLNAGWTGNKGANVRIAVGKNYQLWDGSAPSVARRIDGDGKLDFGQIYLEKTEGTDEMILQLQSTNQGGSAVFWWVEAVEFIKIEAV